VGEGEEKDKENIERSERDDRDEGGRESGHKR